jgi:DNA-directed RNA polymerase specialized sigma24 family protein
MERFVADWPNVNRAVARSLTLRGCCEQDRQDLEQETAIRIINRRLPYGSLVDLTRYAVKVAYHLFIDLKRQGNDCIALSTFHDRASADLETTVEHRIALESIYTQLRSLGIRDLQLLESEPAEGLPRQEAVRLNVRRHRLRVQLKALAGGLLAAVIALGAPVSSLHAKPHRASRAGLAVLGGPRHLKSELIPSAFPR